MPSEFGNVEGQILIWFCAMIRPGAAFFAAPVFGAPSVPVQLRLIIALGVGIPAAAASRMALPVQGIVSFTGIMFLTAEVSVGLALGFALQIGFAAALLAGELISNAMGLGFATINGPVGGHASPAIGQFLSMLATFLFLSLDGHLALAEIIVESYRALPPGTAWLSHDAIGGIIQFGGLIFSAGLSIALPVGFVMILVQIIMAMITRSTPTLNLFSVGVPATVLAGIIMLAIAVPNMATSIRHAVVTGIDQSRRLTLG